MNDSKVKWYVGIMKNKHVSYWNQTPQQSPKLSFSLLSIKKDYKPSRYPVLTRKNPSRKALLRITSHQLRIETGRYKKIPRNERVCSFCNSYRN